MKTIRELINEKRDKILNQDLTKQEASKMLVEFSALMGNVTEEIRIREAKYNQVLAEQLAQEKSVARAEVLSKITPEYRKFRRARDEEKVLIELIRSLKYYLKAKGDEWEAAGNL